MALRLAGRAPASSLVVVLSIGAALGLTATVYSLIHSLIRNPISAARTSQVVFLSGLSDPPVGTATDWWSRTHSLELLSAYGSSELDLRSVNYSAPVRAGVISRDFLQLLGVAPVIGRPFSPGECEGEARVLLLGHRTWVEQYRKSEQVLGSELTLNGRRYTVIGVLPPGFTFPAGAQLWLPGRTSSSIAGRVFHNHDGDRLAMGVGGGWLARLRPGFSIENARSELMVLLRQLNEAYSRKYDVHFGELVTVRMLNHVLGRDYQTTLFVLFAAACCVLMAGLANAAIVLLSQNAMRSHTVAVRLALGASAWRLSSQALTESLIFTLFAGIVAIGVAALSAGALRRTIQSPAYAVSEAAALPPGVALFVFASAVIAGVLVGALQALQARSTSMAGVLHGGAPGLQPQGRAATRRLLVAVEVCLAMMLSVACVTVVRTFWHLSRVDPGFAPTGLVGAKVTLPKDTPTRLLLKQFNLLQAVEAVPGVSSVAMAEAVPLGVGELSYLYVTTEGARGMASATLATREYFRTMGIPLLAGRPMGDGTNGVVINQAMAKRLWQRSDVVGKAVRLDGEDGVREVIGVVGDVRLSLVSEDVEPQMYLPYGFPYRGLVRSTSSYVVFRCTGPCSPRITAVTASAVSSTFSFEELMDRSIGPVRQRVWLVSSYAFTTLVLAMAGVYALASFMVRSRRYELAVRRAVGAQSSDVITLVTREISALLALGIAAGTILSILAGNLIAKLIQGAQVLDGLGFLAAAFALITTAALAILLPAREAITVHPSGLLRHL